MKPKAAKRPAESNVHGEPDPLPPSRPADRDVIRDDEPGTVRVVDGNFVITGPDGRDEYLPTRVEADDAGDADNPIGEIMFDGTTVTVVNPDGTLRSETIRPAERPIGQVRFDGETVTVENPDGTVRTERLRPSDRIVR